MKKTPRFVLILACVLCFSSIASAQNAISFTPAKSYPAGGFTAANVAPGDFNGDGTLDLAVANFNTSNVGVLLGNGDGSFKAPWVTGNIGTHPQSIAVGDFNGDGKLDLAVGTGDPDVRILLGNGDGTFQFFFGFGVPPNSGTVVVADFNGDGKLDLAVGVSNNVSVLLGNGAGTFQMPPLNFFLGSSSPSDVKAGDFNGDGKSDIAYTDNTSRSVNILTGNGDGTFQAGASIGLGNPLGRLTVADFNADGKPDLALTSGGTSLGFIIVHVLLGTGAGTFNGGSSNNIFNLSQPVGGFVAPSVTNLVAADFNGDGKLDIVAPDPNLHVVHALAGNGDGTFQSPTSAGGTSQFALFGATGDFDGNGSPDLVIANNGDGSTLISNVSVLINTAGNPPLLAALALNPASVEGGNSSQGTVTLGGPAPAGGDTVALSSSNPSVASIPTSVFIPAGVTRATFSISTTSVAAATNSMISADLNGVTQTATFTVVPSVVFTSFTLNPTSVFGGNAAQGTVSLQGPAPSGGVTITLSSSNAGVASAPASVTIPAGSSNATFSVNTQTVTSDSTVTISATVGSVTKTAALTVQSPRDRVAITKAEFNTSPKVRQLQVEATSSSSTATLTVFLTSTGQTIGTLTNSGGGKYKGQFFIQFGTPQNITVKSSLGGTAVKAVTVK